MLGAGRGWVGAALVLAALVACGGREVEPEPADPVATARALIGAVKSGRCDEAWRFLSEPTRRSIRERARLEIHQAPYYVDSFSPYHLLCKHTIIAECVPESARLDADDGDRAVVAVMRLEARDFRLPGFSPRSYEQVPATLEFTREVGRWRLDLAMGRPQDLEWDEVTVGGLAVRFHEFGGKTTVWAEGVVDARVKGVQTVVTDVPAWPRLVPWIKEVGILPGPEEERRDRRARLRIESPGGASVATVVRARPYAEAGSSSSCCFGMGGVALDDGDAPALGVSDLMIVAYPEGDGRTHVQLGYRIEPRRVPPELADRMLSAEAVAGLFLAIERAARTQ